MDQPAQLSPNCCLARSPTGGHEGQDRIHEKFLECPASAGTRKEAARRQRPSSRQKIGARGLSTILYLNTRHIRFVATSSSAASLRSGFEK